MTVDGMLTSAGDALMLTVAPPVPAGDVRATVQVETVGGVIDIGLQENPFNPGKMVTVPPVADAGIAAAEEFAAAGPRTWTVEEVFAIDGET